MLPDWGWFGEGRPELRAVVEGVGRLGRDEFSEQLRRHVKSLWLVAAAWVPPAEVEDVLQESWSTAWSRRDEFLPGTDFRAWIGQIVRFIAANTRRRVRRRDAGLPDHLIDRAPNWPAVDQAGQLLDLQGSFDDEVVRSLDQLSPDRRACLLLRVLEGLGLAEISGVLGLPEGTVASHVHRAQAHLRAQLAGYDSNSRPRPSAQTSTKDSG